MLLCLTWTLCKRLSRCLVSSPQIAFDQILASTIYVYAIFKATYVLKTLMIIFFFLEDHNVFCDTPFCGVLASPFVESSPCIVHRICLLAPLDYKTYIIRLLSASRCCRLAGCKCDAIMDGMMALTSNYFRPWKKPGHLKLPRLGYYL